MFGPRWPRRWLGATTLLSAADRLPAPGERWGHRARFAAGTALIALPAADRALFTVVLASAWSASLGREVRWGLLNEILSADGKGRLLLGAFGFNMMSGYADRRVRDGRAVVTLLCAAPPLLLAAALYSDGGRRPPPGPVSAARRALRPPAVAATWRTNALLCRPPAPPHLPRPVDPKRPVVGCESALRVLPPRQRGQRCSPCAALGMLAGDVTVGRLVAARRAPPAGTPLLLFLALPYASSSCTRRPRGPPSWHRRLRGVGASLVFLQQERLMALTPDELSGHALGLHSPESHDAGCGRVAGRVRWLSHLARDGDDGDGVGIGRVR